jgi:hypothetical protein
MKTLLLFFFSFICLHSYSQINWSWVSSGGGTLSSNPNNVINGIDLDENNNTYVIGTITPPSVIDSIVLDTHGLSDVLLAKYNEDGDLIWAQTAGGKSFDVGSSISYMSGYLYVCGTYLDTIRFGNQAIPPKGGWFERSFFIAKLDTNGNYIWIKTGVNNHTVGYQAYPLMDLVTDGNGNVYYSGYCSHNAELIDTNYIDPNLMPAYYISQLDTSGTLNWIRFKPCYGAAANTDIAMCIEEDMDQKLLLYATSPLRVDTITNGPNSITGYANPIIGKVNANGQKIWEIEVGDTNLAKWGAYPATISVAPNNQLFIAGIYHTSFEWSSTINGNGGSFIASLNTIDGTILYSRNLQSSNNRVLFIYGCDYRKGTVTYAGNLYGTVNFGGISLSPQTVHDGDMFVANYDINGTLNWATRYGFDGYNMVWSSSINRDMYVVGGTFVDSLALGSHIVYADSFNPNARSFFVGAQYELDTVPDPTSIPLLFSKNDLNVFPNPVQSTLSIELNGVAANSIEILSLEGKSIMQLPTHNTSQVDVSILPPGIYFISIKTEKMQVIKRIVKI